MHTTGEADYHAKKENIAQRFRLNHSEEESSEIFHISRSLLHEITRPRQTSHQDLFPLGAKAVTQLFSPT
jgi:hypothetical protein